MERRRQVAVAAGDDAPRARRSPRRSSRSPATAWCSPPRSASPDRTSRGRPRSRRAPSRAGGSTGARWFCTMSPAATHLYVAVTYADERTSATPTRWCPPTPPASSVNDDWDALGMRASGSNSVTFDGVELPRVRRARRLPAGDPVPYMERNLVAGLFHASASLGIAESADAIARRLAGAPTATPARACRWPTTRSTSPPPRRPVARGRADRRAPRRQPGGRRHAGSSTRSSPRRRRPRRSSTRPPPASSSARSRCPVARATSTAARSRAPTATSRPARSCTRSAPTAPTTTSPTPRSASRRRCTERRDQSPRRRSRRRRRRALEELVSPR